MKRKIRVDVKDFLVLWAGQTLSQLGSRMTAFALVIWSYTQTNTAMSVALLTGSIYLPEIVFMFLGGAVADRCNRKLLMFLSDAVAALGTLAVLLIYRAGTLSVFHLYGVNLLIGMMNAFQSPASTAAVSQLVPEGFYAKASGLQSLSNAVIALSTPALAAALMAFGNLEMVLYADLSTFVLASVLLLGFVRLPPLQKGEGHKARGGTLEGLRFLRKNPLLLRLILFFAGVNLLSSMAGNGIMPAMILARTDGSEKTLGVVSSCIGLGTLLGSIVATAAPAPKNRLRVVFACCGLSFFLCDVLWGVGHTAWVWALAALLGNFPVPVLNANLMTVYRKAIPLEMHGHVFAAQGALQYGMIPLGYVLGGVLSDYVMEPLMRTDNIIARAFTPLVGSGAGSGMAVLFLFAGVLGGGMCLREMFHPLYKAYESGEAGEKITK